MLRFRPLALTGLLLLLASPLLADTIKLKPGDDLVGAFFNAEPNDTIVLGKGVYRGVLIIPADKTGLTLLGKGAVIHALFADAPAGPGLRILADDVTVKGLTVLHARTGPSPFQPIGSPPEDGEGIHVFGAGVTLENVVVGDCESNGVRVEGENAVLSRVTTRQSGGDGLLVLGAGAKITKCSSSRSDGTGINVVADEALIQNNSVDHALIGIRASGATIDILGNRIAHTSIAAVVSASSDARLEKNRVEVSGAIFVSASSGTTILKNRLDDLPFDAISIEGGDNSTVSGNRIRATGAGNGISVGGGHTGELVVSDNRIQGVRHTAIELNSVDTAQVDGNRIADCATGIQLVNQVMTGSSISANKIADISAIGIHITGVGITLEDNSVSRGLRHGIQVGGQDHLLDGNKLSKLAGEGIRNFALLTRLKDNRVSGALEALTDIAGGANLDDLGGNKFGKGFSFKPGVPEPGGF